TFVVFGFDSSTGALTAAFLAVVFLAAVLSSAVFGADAFAAFGSFTGDLAPAFFAAGFFVFGVVVFSSSISAVMDFFAAFFAGFSDEPSAFFADFLAAGLSADVFFPATAVDLAALDAPAFFADVFLSGAATGLAFVLI
ncbi:MAG: hypothetical protein IKW80_06640, partial [Thermoguttaceae bacterium]|nr:hypothetical protein [Thermoguttaceae bacterium]